MKTRNIKRTPITMKIKQLLFPLFLCIIVLLSGCNQPPTPARDEGSPSSSSEPSSTSNSTTPTTTTDETTGILLATQVPIRIVPGATVNEQPTGRHDNEYLIYRNEFTTTFDELCEYAEDPEACQTQIEDFKIQIADEQKADPYRPDITILDYIRIGNLGKEDLVDYFEGLMQERIDNGWVKSDEDKRLSTYFSYEELDALFSGDERYIKELFKVPEAVLTEDNELYSFRWFTDHSVAEWRAAGVTEENAKEAIACWKTVYGDLYLDWVGISDKLEEFYAA